MQLRLYHQAKQDSENDSTFFQLIFFQLIQLHCINFHLKLEPPPGIHGGANVWKYNVHSRKDHDGQCQWYKVQLDNVGLLVECNHCHYCRVSFCCSEFCVTFLNVQFSCFKRFLFFDGMFNFLGRTDLYDKMFLN